MKHELLYEPVETFSMGRSHQKYSQLVLSVSISEAEADLPEGESMIGKPIVVDDSDISLGFSPSSTRDVSSKAIESEVSVPPSDSYKENKGHLLIYLVNSRKQMLGMT